MSAMVDDQATEATGLLAVVATELQALDLTTSSDEAVVEFLRGMQTFSNRLAAVEHAVINEIESRSIPWSTGHASTTSFLRDTLRVHPGEAAARVRAAHALGTRRSLTGEPLEPVYPSAAAAVSSGAISPRHAMVVVDTVEKLPVDVRAVSDRHVEAILTEHAHTLDPKQLAQGAARVRELLDPDGRDRDADYAQARREVRLARSTDGSGTLAGKVTAELAELLEVVFDACGKPVPGPDGTRDPRTASQRRHDALADALRRSVGAGVLPDTGGCAATLILTMDVDTFASEHGTARTGHGYVVPAELAKRWLGAEARAILVLLSQVKGITEYSSVQRLFTEQQRLAMAARDRGCTYPGCDVGAQSTEAHHVIEYRISGRTRVDEGALLCTKHHATFEAMGWRNVMLDGRPHWVPPTWIDPAQAPRRNTMHDDYG